MSTEVDTQFCLEIDVHQVPARYFSSPEISEMPSMVGGEDGWDSTPTEDESANSMPSTPKDDREADPMMVTSPGESATKGFNGLREQELSSETPNSLLFQSPPSPFRKRHVPTAGKLDKPLLERRDSMHSSSPLSPSTIKIRKISDPAAAVFEKKDRAVWRRASTTTLNNTYAIPERKSSLSFFALQRRPSDMVINMRRESVAEKFEMEMNLSRPQSPSTELLPKQKKPTSTQRLRRPSRRTSYSRSRWSSDEEEGDAEEVVMDDVTVLSTARRVSRADSVTLPIYLQARRASCATTVNPSNVETASASSDVVKLITALQASHLEETRRLNEIIASLSTKVATLESDLYHVSTMSSSGCLRSPSRPEHSWKSSAYRMDNTRSTFEDQLGMAESQQNLINRLQQPSDPRRMSLVSPSPRSLSFNYL